MRAAFRCILTRLGMLDELGGAVMLIYGDMKSGNCLKVKWTADFLGLEYKWCEVDILKSESRTIEFLRMNPAGQVPVVRLSNGFSGSNTRTSLTSLWRASRCGTSARLPPSWSPR